MDSFIFLASVVIHGLGALLQSLFSKQKRGSQRSYLRIGALAVNIALIGVSTVACTSLVKTSLDFTYTRRVFASFIGVIIGAAISVILTPFYYPSVLQAVYELVSCISWAILLIQAPVLDWVSIAIPSLYLTSFFITIGTPRTSSLAEAQNHPFSHAPFLPTFTLSWLDPVLQLAASRPLSIDDTWPVDRKLSVGSTQLQPIFQSFEFRHGVAKGFDSVLWRNFKGGMVSSFLLAVVNVATALAQPFFLQSLIENGDLLSVTGLFLASLMAGATEAHMKLQLRKIGVQLRSALTSLLCDQCMSATDGKESGADPAVLIEVDCGKVFDLVEQYHVLWMAAVQSAISIAALVLLLGWQSVLAGAISPFVMMPMLAYTTSRISQRMTDFIEAKDTRVRLITQVIKQIKQIKLDALAYLFERKIDDQRATELEKYKAIAKLNSCMVFLVYVLPPALISVTFGTSILLGHSLPSSVVFPALAFCFNITRSVSLLPRLVMLYYGGRISFGRIQGFLLAANDEKDTTSQNIVLNPHDIPRTGSVGFRIRDCEIAFPGSTKTLLQIRNIEASSASLLVISGPVGCGKTTLIRSIIGEIRPPVGDIEIQGNMAYAPQKPFLVSGTIRDNILFGLPFDGPFYKKVLVAVTLNSDLARLPAGDATILGGTGVALSGGQKARIGLARAIYSRREVIVLDDPLAAVDAKVRSHLINRLFGSRGLLKDTLQIVTTSSDALMAQADKLYVIRDGILSETDPPSRAHEEDIGDFPDEELETRQELDKFTSSTSSICYGSIKPNASNRAMSPRPVNDEETAPLLSRTRPGDPAPDTTDSPVRLGTYLRFLKLAKPGGWLVVLMTAAASKLLDILAVYFLKLSSQEFESQGHSFKLAYYSVCALVGGLLSSVFVLVAYFLCVIPSSRSIHAELTKGILRSKFSFFDTTSLGDILNRFTNDINKIDTTVSAGLIGIVALCVTATASVLIIVAATPISILYLAPIGLVYFAIQAYYLHACRQLRRLEVLARGPILNTASEMRVGASVIGTFNQEAAFKEKANNVIDNHIRIWAPFVALDCWLMLRLQLLSSTDLMDQSIIQLLSAGLLLWLRTPASTLGLVMNFQIQITSQFNNLVQLRANLEADITSAERVWACAAEEPENQPDDEIRPPASWPQNAAITFSSYTASYKPNDQPCLHNLNFTIQPGEHVAVVGRTGAGKSSLTLALLRALHHHQGLAGTIEIDGLNISDIDLMTLRKRITMIPQEPALFGGTVRNNLDLEGARTDEQLREALELCQMSRIFNLEPDQDPLEYPISDFGANLSGGQIQILALSRAILEKNDIVIMDEATAAMDAPTMAIIHRVIKHRFRHHTVITITHHIESALEHDKVLVMHDGRVTNFATPGELLKDKDSILSQLVAESRRTTRA
ncbi:unnamed protein product [Clonostachys byssicola]|uniref:Uncharacterized protein n=1 Tax=Clonostachys byssicola TaxID=160290 RepID=A0A9N9Y2X6_9HYPO|nr:unnamed protein product [Clonostachys byssicola]